MQKLHLLELLGGRGDGAQRQKVEHSYTKKSIQWKAGIGLEHLKLAKS